MSLNIKELQTKCDYKKFVELPFEIYKNSENWVPPLKKDELKSLQPEFNPAFEFCDAKFWIVLKDDKCVGRIGAIINRTHNEMNNSKIGRFAKCEFIDDLSVSKLLFETAEKWIKEKGMEQVMGPLGFSNLDTQGLLIEGHDYLPSIASTYHLPYYKEHIEKLGYDKEIDWVEFQLFLGKEIPAKAIKLSDMIKKRYNLKVIHFKTRAEAEVYADKIFNVLNQAFAKLFSVVPFNDKMIKFLSEKYFSILNPKFIKVVENDKNEVVGFIVGLPSLSKAMQKANGKLFPFGFLHIMKALKNPDVVDLLLTGILPEMQAMGVSALLITELQQVMIDHKVKHVETTGIFETNHDAINHWKNYENNQHKRRRCFKKAL